MKVLHFSFSLTKSQRLQFSTVPSYAEHGAPPELVGVGVEKLETRLLEVGAGSGSLEALMEYEFPVSRFLHSAVMEGSHSQSKRYFLGLERLSELRKGQKLPAA
jgi:hypothetical protein